MTPGLALLAACADIIGATSSNSPPTQLTMRILRICLDATALFLPAVTGCREPTLCTVLVDARCPPFAPGCP